MWLLDTDTGVLHYVSDPLRERYAILSHVWDPEKEQSFQDIQRLCELARRSEITRRLLGRPPRSALSKASDKIRDCCAFARKRGYKRVWIDTCCIDKTSSSELSEAINSMYKWYQQAAVCYAFLYDVDEKDDHRAWSSCFRRSKWFRRGWTLQELIAPRKLVFLSKHWRPLGTKSSLADVVEEITGIERDVLELRIPLDSVSVARRMSWGSRRTTTRVEDEAYSLMGIFDVNIPVIYGEGRNAFYRLQEEILRRIPDQSIFAWGSIAYTRSGLPLRPFANAEIMQTKPEDAPFECIFASSPAAFEHSANIVPVALDEFYRRVQTEEQPIPEYLLTSYGIRGRFPRLLGEQTDQRSTGNREHERSEPNIDIVVLACEDTSEGLIALLLRASDCQNRGNYHVGARFRYRTDFARGATLQSLVGVSRAPNRFKGHFQLTSVYIPYRPQEKSSSGETNTYDTSEIDSIYDVNPVSSGVIIVGDDADSTHRPSSLLEHINAATRSTVLGSASPPDAEKEAGFAAAAHDSPSNGPDASNDSRPETLCDMLHGGMPVGLEEQSRPAYARYSFDGHGEGELPLKTGQELEILDDRDAAWWYARDVRSGQEGVVPAALVY
ncbi:heterokaryon incompatibility protein-domain-containing protein [Trametes punicea]|nr:heterokaryon incompatibility protein-domain-containing protein [Trametes punicea]